MTHANTQSSISCIRRSAEAHTSNNNLRRGAGPLDSEIGRRDEVRAPFVWRTRGKRPRSIAECKKLCRPLLHSQYCAIFFPEELHLHNTRSLRRISQASGTLPFCHRRFLRNWKWCRFSCFRCPLCFAWFCLAFLWLLCLVCAAAAFYLSSWWERSRDEWVFWRSGGIWECQRHCLVEW